MPWTITGTTIQTVGSHQNSNVWPWDVTKRSLKITITATMARGDKEVYIHPPPPTPPTPIEGTWKESDILVLFHYIVFIIWELSSINFGIEGVVAGTTPVTILRIIQLHLDVFTTTDKFTLHQISCSKELWILCFFMEKLSPSIYHKLRLDHFHLYAAR